MLRHLSAAVSLLLPRLSSSSSRTISLTLPRAGGGMEAAWVRCVPGEPKLSVSFRLDGTNRHLLRDPQEPLGKALARISHGLVKRSQDKKRKKKNREEEEEEEPVPVVKLYRAGEEVPESVTNFEAWRDGAELVVGAHRLPVRRNSPAFTAALLPAALMAGFPVTPKLEVEFGQLNQSRFTWFREDRPRPDDASASAADDVSWSEVGVDRVFVPSNQDIGCRLKLSCVAGDGHRYGAQTDLISSGVVEAGPGACTFDNRHLYTARALAWPAVRVASYNILADAYAQTEESRTLLYPYCASYALLLDYRQNLLRKELAGYHADIVCLQEVDKGVFVDSLTPALDAFHLDGVFTPKPRQHEGLATFYRRSRFRLLTRHDITLSEALTSDPEQRPLLEELSTNQTLKEKTLKRSSVLQVSVLEEVNSPERRKVCVANTHLFWHPKAGNVRLVQVGVALKHLSHVIGGAEPGIPVIFCGDFNSCPDSGVFQLLTESLVPGNHGDWSSSGPEEALSLDPSSSSSSPLLSSSLPPLLSACGRPAYTNYVGGFHGCLDYIFIQPHAMQVEQVIPLPSHEEVTTHQALPSVAHPSDHIALVCDLRWNP